VKVSCARRCASRLPRMTQLKLSRRHKFSKSTRVYIIITSSARDGMLASRASVAPCRAPLRVRTTRVPLRSGVLVRAAGNSGPSLGRVLVLGGTGFVGSKICQEALDAGYDVVSVSRRGTPPDAGSSGASDILKNVDWRVGDATNPATALDILGEGEPFVGVIHAVGMLLASDWNQFASGSGSVPDKNATYDLITRVTAFNAADATIACVGRSQGIKGSDGTNSIDDAETKTVSPPPFVFVSAAEAKWDFKAPVPWLEEYLVAKRAVEKRLTQLNSENKLRASWLRPSLVYTFDKPAALPAVAAFTIGNLIGLPFVDKPVTVDTLAKAAVRAIGDGATSGVLDWKEMERLAGE